jgi:hypothetical protein
VKGGGGFEGGGGDDVAPAGVGVAVAAGVGSETEGRLLLGEADGVGAVEVGRAVGAGEVRGGEGEFAGGGDGEGADEQGAVGDQPGALVGEADACGPGELGEAAVGGCGVRESGQQSGARRTFQGDGQPQARAVGDVQGLVEDVTGLGLTGVAYAFVSAFGRVYYTAALPLTADGRCRSTG